MRDLIKQINELEKSAKQNEKDAKYYRERYEELRDALKIRLNEYDKTTSELFDLMLERRGSKHGKRSKTDSKEFHEIADEFYRKMIVDNKEVRTEDIIKELEKRDMFSGNSGSTKIRILIRKKEGIKERKEKLNIILFCDREDDEIKQKKLDFAKEIGTIVETKKPTDEGEIDFVDLGGGTRIEKNKKYRVMR